MVDIFDLFVIYNRASGVLGGNCICVGFGRGAWFIMAFIHGEDIWEENGLVMTVSTRMGHMPRLYFNRSAIEMYEEWFGALNRENFDHAYICDAGNWTFSVLSHKFEFRFYM
jgi:hypothetical protein